MSQEKDNDQIIKETDEESSMDKDSWLNLIFIKSY